MKIDDINFDLKHIWHPYTSMNNPIPTYPVISASGVKLKLANGKKIIDGMSSWWSVIHGYNHPVINQAAINQIKKMSHVMFGGITHIPAIELSKQLLKIVDNSLECIFFADSGSVAVDIALKMAMQYWKMKKQNRTKFIALEYSYHGDTLGAMSVCDPKNSMHHLYSGYFSNNFFVKAPKSTFHSKWNFDDTASFKMVLEKNFDKIAAVILEPIVQGAGGMRFYHPNYLKYVRKLCNKYNILLIADEIATGFGRTGKLFAYEHSNVIPDILCVGKALTGGYLTLSAVITTRKIANTISDGNPGCFMHGPTFMANPLACSISLASIKLLMQSSWKKNVKNIENQLIKDLIPIKDVKTVKDVRILGAIGVIEMYDPVNIINLQKFFVSQGIWVRPFKNLIYLMPPYIIQKKEIKKLTNIIKLAIYQNQYK
ncbi:MAG: adenosylmethionine--8-amino-7-oxononanoate transaminase [Arsenophonus sp.]|nr:MAG: adenosylmethionine--8-amino-7-oxononanoate transaminase [Arsenophonus sp.]